MRLEQFRQAVPLFAELLPKRSGGVRVSREVHRQISLGNAARDAKAWLPAARAYGAALEHDPTLSHIWIQRGHAHKEAGEFDKAVVAYQRADELDPGSTEPQLHLGHIAKIQGDVRAATQHYARAARHRPPCAAAVAELSNLVAKGMNVDMAQFASIIDDQLTLNTPGPFANTGEQASVEEEQSRQFPASGTCLVFDISDLVSYFRHSRTPTGIQRVQIEVLHAAFAMEGIDVRVCAFQEALDEWVELPKPLFRELCELTNSQGEAEWSTCLAKVTIQLGIGIAFRFPRGALLINLGTSWWIPNYFMYVRRAQAEAGIRYVPFVHDMIPLVRSDVCPPLLVRDFTAWVASVLEHADFYLVNSNSTKKDLISVSAYLGQPIEADRIQVVPLDATHGQSRNRSSGPSILAKNGLQRSDYVLIVSTIEPRKNHLLAFEAWLKLIERHGAKRVPKLVCVGNPGWMNEPIHEFLHTQQDLRSKVLILWKISDDDLAELYQRCLFTLYPSQYEGWGLPVTESLCHGKVPLCSRVSSIPEAGGPFADYFNVASRAELIEGVEKLAFDASYRKEREKRITTEFRPRSWQDIAEQIVGNATEWAETEHHVADAPLPIRTGYYYSLSRDLAPRLWPGLRSTERLRTGFNWWGRDPWGCWTKPGGAALRFAVDHPERPHRVYLLLLGMPNVPCELRIDANGVEAVAECTLEPNERKWIGIEMAPSSASDRAYGIDLVCSTFEDLGKIPVGGDTRAIAVGVCGLYVCDANDATARMALLEAISLTSIDTLSINRPSSDFMSLSAFIEGERHA